VDSIFKKSHWLAKYCSPQTVRRFALLGGMKLTQKSAVGTAHINITYLRHLDCLAIDIPPIKAKRRTVRWLQDFSSPWL